MEDRRTARPRGTDSARVISVIETKALRGAGTREDLCREVIQYWDLDGNLLAEKDTFNPDDVLPEGGGSYTGPQSAS